MYTVRYADRMRALKPSPVQEILAMSTNPDIIAFSAGNPCADAFPLDDIRRISAELLAEDPVTMLQYGRTEGYQPLRQRLMALCRDRYHVGRDFDEIMITTGAQQIGDLLTKCVCNPGDAIICEDPSYVGCLNTFRSFEGRTIGVSMDGEGIDMALLEQAFVRERGRIAFLYLIPTFQNPTGLTMSRQRRKQVYELCKRHGVLIFEDNPYGDLRFEGEAIDAIKSLDEDGLVVYAGTFSKVLAPGFRLGYAVAQRSLLTKLASTKQSQDVHCAAWGQYVAERFLATADLEAHFARLREIYGRKCRLMIQSLEENLHPSIHFTRPEGGLFVWATLPEGWDMTAFCRTAVAHGVAVVPGSAFTCDPEATSRSFRMNFSAPSDEQIVRGAHILGEVSRMF